MTTRSRPRALRLNLIAATLAGGSPLLQAQAQAQTPPAEPAVLSPVVVTATMGEREKLASPAFTTVISREDIAKTPVNSLPDLLRDTVGVTNQTDSGGRDEIQIRGLDGRYTLILVNGKRVSSSGALWRGSDFDLNTVPLASIERVEVVRGPMSALYGSDAIGGVVNIITRRPTTQWQGEVNAELRRVASGDQGDQWRVGGAASGALGQDVSLAVAGEVQDRQAWYAGSASNPTEAPALEAKRSASLSSTLSLRLDERHSLDVDLGYQHDKRPYALDDYVYYPAWNYESYSYSAQQIDRGTLALTHNGSWSWGRSFTSLKREQASIDDYDTDYDAPQQRHYREANTHVRSYGVARLGAQTLTAGLDLRRQEIRDTSTYLDTGKVATTQSAVFAQDEVRLGQDWLLTLGGRLDHHPDFGQHVSPKAYLNYFLSDSIALKGGVSRSFKAPDAYQLSTQYRVISCGGSCYLSGNPDLTPEQGTSAELGLEIDRAHWGLSVVAFHNKVRDMIVAVYDASVPSRAWQNVASAKTRGLELEGRYRASRALTLKANLAWLRGDYTDESGATVKLENRPERKLTVNADWHITDTLSTQLTVSHVGRQYYEDSELPAYTRVDLGTSARLAPAVTLRAGVKNLGDVNLKDKNASFVGNELGRNYYVSASYTF